MKRTLRLSLMGIVLMFPLVTQAAWWNPTTWIEPKVEIRYVEKIVEVPVEVIKEVPVEVEKVVEKVKVIEKPVEKIVTQNVATVMDNPELVERIESLQRSLKMIAEEKDEIEREYKRQIQELRNELSVYVTKLYKGEMPTTVNSDVVNNLSAVIVAQQIIDSRGEYINSKTENPEPASDRGRRERCKSSQRYNTPPFNQACDVLGY